MKTILCYGDSNTWGFDARTQGRFHREVRWPGALQRLLGEGYCVVEEGLCGRTVANSTATEPEINGLHYLSACLKSHAPLDYVVLMLGSNDLQVKYNAVPLEIARCLERMVQYILSPYSHGFGQVPRILLISPPPVGEGIRRFALRDLFGAETCMERSIQLVRRIRMVAKTCGCMHLDAGSVVRACQEDGLHLDAENHRLLAAAVRDMILAQET